MINKTLWVSGYQVTGNSAPPRPIGDVPVDWSLEKAVEYFINEGKIDKSYVKERGGRYFEWGCELYFQEGRTTKLELDDDFNIIDPEAEAKKAEAIRRLKSDLEDADMQRSNILEDLYDVDERIREIKATLKGYGQEV